VIVLGESIAIGVAFYLWATRQPVTIALRSWVLLGVFSVVAAVVWYYLLQRPEWLNLTPPQNPNETLSQLERLGSPFWGPSNYFASMLLLFIPFGFSSRLNIWLRVTMVGLGVIAIIGTLSRGAALAVVIASVLLFLIIPRTRWPRLPFPAAWLIAPAGAIVAVLLWAILNRPDLGFNFFHDPSRASYYDVALRLLARRPIIGSGYGTWPSLVTGNAAKGVHNYYLQIAVETGLIGAGLFIAAFAAMVVRARKLAPDLAVITTAVLLLVAVNITVEASFEGEIFSWLLAIFLGITFAWPTQRIDRPADYRETFRVVHRH
jgi:O-antigen ligase